MLRFYHIGGCIQRSPQQTERINSHSRRPSLAKDATDTDIQHPSRYFKRRFLRVLADATDKHDRSAPVSLSMDRYLLSVERMPRIKHFARFGFMGLPSLGCTMKHGRTQANTALAKHLCRLSWTRNISRMKNNSTACPSGLHQTDFPRATRAWLWLRYLSDQV